MDPTVVGRGIDKLGVNKTMSGATRSKLLLAGSAIAFVGCLVPGVYSVSYSPPAGSGYPAVGDKRLAGFNGVFNAFQGPYSFSVVVVSIVVLAILGMIAPMVLPKHFDKAVKGVKYGVGAIIHQTVGIAAGLVAVIFFIWDYRYRQSPQSIRDKFVAQLGGGSVARDASHYVTGGLGAATLIILVGLMIAMIGILPGPIGWVLGVLLALLLLACCLGILGVRIPYLINDDRYDNRPQPQVTMAHCLFDQGTVDACASGSGAVTLDLRGFVVSGKTCKSTLVIDWGDGSKPQTVQFSGSTGKIDYLAAHTYRTAGKFTIKQTEPAKNAGCQFGAATFGYIYLGH